MANVSQKVTLAFGSKAWYARGREVESVPRDERSEFYEVNKVIKL